MACYFTYYKYILVFGDSKIHLSHKLIPFVFLSCNHHYV